MKRLLLFLLLLCPLLLSAQPWDEGKQPKVQYLLNDDFSDDRAAGAVNGTYAFPGPGVRTVTDTESKLSLSGGNLVFSGGKASPAYGDPEVSFGSFSRLAGRTLFSDFSVTTANKTIFYGWAQNAVAANLDDGMRVGTSSTFTYYSTTIGAALMAYSAGVTYKTAFTLRPKGCFLFLKSTGNYELIWITSSANTATLYPALNNYSSETSWNYLRIPTDTFIPAPLVSDSFTRANGAIGSTDGLGHQERNGGSGLAWSGSTWGILGNAATNAPGTGGELLLNPDLEAPYLASGVATNWSKSGTPTPTEETTIVYSGSSSQKMVSSADNEYVYQKPTTVIGSWYIMSCWGYEATGDAAGTISLGHLYIPTGNQTKQISPDSTWTQFISTGRANRTDAYLRVLHSTTTSSTAYIDNTSIKQLNLTNCINPIYPPLSTPNVIIDCSFTRGTTGFQTGIAANWKADYSQGLLAYYDGNGVANLDYCSNSVWYNWITGAITYSDGAPIRLISVPSSGEMRLYYNNALVGAKTSGVDQTLTNNRICGMFTTWTNASINGFVVYARGSEGQYSILDKY